MAQSLLEVGYNYVILWLITDALSTTWFCSFENKLVITYEWPSEKYVERSSREHHVQINWIKHGNIRKNKVRAWLDPSTVRI